MELETADHRPPSIGDVMLWIAKPRRAGRQPVQRVRICHKYGGGNFVSYHVEGHSTRAMHTAKASSLVWEDSLKRWLESPLTPSGQHE